MKLTNFIFLYLVDEDYLLDCAIDGCFGEDSPYYHIFENIDFDSDSIYEDLRDSIGKWATNNKVEIQSTELTDCDLDDRSITYRMVFSMNGHYYAFYYYYSDYEGFCCDEIDQEIDEVFPVEKTVIFYEPKKNG